MHCMPNHKLVGCRRLTAIGLRSGAYDTLRVFLLMKSIRTNCPFVDALQRNRLGDPLTLPTPYRADLEDLSHEQMMRTAIDTAVSLRDAAEPHEHPLMRLRRDVAVALGQRRIAHQQQRLRLVAGDDRTLIVADVEAAHLDLRSARD